MGYMKKEEKRNQKNFYCSCCCNLTKKKLSLKLYMCKLFLKGNLPKVVENQYLLDVLLPIISQKKNENLKNIIRSKTNIKTKLKICRRRKKKKKKKKKFGKGKKKKKKKKKK